jgi:adenylate cyclase class 2
MPENLEIKLRVTKLRELERIAEGIGTCVFDDRQVDTYFHTRSGRLKLRETSEGSELIFYHRPDKPSARLCDYMTIQINDPRKLKLFLSDLLGVKQVVKKCRTVYLYRTARIQLDRVQKLGSFIEFEIPSCGKRQRARSLMRSLLCRFQLENERPIPDSYADLIAGSRKWQELWQIAQKSPTRAGSLEVPKSEKGLAKRR